MHTNPITLLSEHLKYTHNITFDEIKNELSKPIYDVILKDTDDDDLALLCYADFSRNKKHSIKDTNILFAEKIENMCRSFVFNKHTLKPVVTQFNRIIYNTDALHILSQASWTQVVVQPCHEGTLILVFNYNDKWYVTTRKCLDSNNSKWIYNKSYRDMFNDAIDNKLALDDLHKDYSYHFVLVHHKNKNLVNHDLVNRDLVNRDLVNRDLDKEYAQLFHIMTIKKETFEEIDYDIKGIQKINEKKFESLTDVCNSLDAISKNNEDNLSVTSEGFVLKLYQGEIKKSPFTLFKLQTKIYQELTKLKPNNNNINQIYLELYQKDQLTKFIPYITKFNAEIIKRIHVSVTNLADEFLSLYHLTRRKDNSSLYHKLSYQYKKVLYGLHGMYINNKKNDLNNNNTVSNITVSNNTVSNITVSNITVSNNKKTLNNKVSNNNKNDIIKSVEQKARSINVHDVYNYLKLINPIDLRQIYTDREKLLKDPQNSFINKKCISTMTQTKLMLTK
jgi:hypothetical protein